MNTLINAKLILIGLTLIFLIAIFMFFNRIPYGDDYDILHSIIKAYETNDVLVCLEELCKPHMEHRILLIKLFGFLQMKLFGSISLILWSIYPIISFLGILYFLLRIMKEYKINNYVSLSMVIFFFSLSNYNNIFWAMASINNIPILMLFILLYALKSQSKYSLVMAFVSIIIASMSIYTWVILIFSGIFFLTISKDYLKLFLFVIFSFLIYTTFHYNYTPPSNVSYLERFTSLETFVDYIFSVLLLLGSIAHNYYAALILGLLFTILFLFKYKWYLKHPMILTILCTLILICILAPIKRFEGPQYFLGSRYKIYSILIFILLVISFFEDYKRFLTSQFIQGTILCCSILYFSITNFIVFQKMSVRKNKLELSYLNVETNKEVFLYDDDDLTNNMAVRKIYAELLIYWKSKNYINH